MGDDPRLPAMPEQPTLMISSNIASVLLHICCKCETCGKRRIAGQHDPRLSVARYFHHWLHPRRPWLLGAQLVEPYVDEELPGPSAPTRCCGSMRTIRSATNTRSRISRHLVQTIGRTLMSKKITSGCVTINVHVRADDHVHDIYSFDPDAKVELEEFTDVIAVTSVSRNKDSGRQQPGRAYVAGDDQAGEVSVEYWSLAGAGRAPPGRSGAVHDCRSPICSTACQPGRDRLLVVIGKR